MNVGKAKLLLLIICFWAINNLFAQNSFSKRYSFNIPGDLFTSMLIGGDTIYIAGISGDTSHNYAEIHAPKSLSGLFDLNGNEIFHNVYTGEFWKSYETFFHSLIQTHDRGFALCGGTIDSNGVNKFIFIKYDSLMNISFIKEISYPDTNFYFEGQSMVELKDGSILIAGELNLNYIANIFFLKIDSNANLIWLKKYNPAPLSYFSPAIIQISDTSILVGCEYSNEGLGPYAITSQTKFFTIDTAGNILNQWMDSNDSTFAPYGLLKTLDGGYAYCGRYMVRMNAPYDIPLTDGVITKLDSNFHLLWRRRFSNDQVFTNQFYQLRQLADGALIAAGQGVGYIAATGADEMTGWFVKVSAAGDSLWSRGYAGIAGAENDNVINDFQILLNGGIIGCGVSTDYSTTQFSQQAWLIRLDSVGCLIPGCDTVTATGINPVAINGNHTGVVVYPNPASNLTYILIKTDNPNPQLSFNIYNVTGQLLTTQPSAAPDVTYLLHVNNYAAGIYFVQVLSNGELVANSKFIKE